VEPGLPARQVTTTLHLQIADEPATFVEAEQHQSWRRVMLEEIESIESNKTWRLVHLPPRHRSIGLKWVYKLKKDAASNVMKHKACLVAKGYIQQQGVNFDEIFALSQGLNWCICSLCSPPRRSELSTTWT
jgi:hypothetical protein